MTEISPAILTNDISDFRLRYGRLFALSQYFTKLHIDFIDDKFIHNKTVMPADLGFLKSSPFLLMAHFMTLTPEIYFEDAKNAGFKWVLFHLEAFNHDSEIQPVIERAKSLGLKPGLVINPATPLHLAGKFLKEVDIIQLMGIQPGFQGRPFMVSTIAKIVELRSLSKSVTICVDGGVKVGIARQCAKAGADILVAGSAILRSEDEELAIEALKVDIES
ncbi:MAG: ribulose-phosphate 3-epimerase [Candidatus Doudnabacteria bacterium]